MKRNSLMVMSTVLLVMVAGCGDASDESSAKSNDESTDSSSTQNSNASNKDLTDIEKDTTEKASEDADKTELNDQEDASDNTYTKSDDGESLQSSNSASEMTESKREEYLKELNDTKKEMEEMRKNPIDDTTFALKKVEGDLYDVWDGLLNEVYETLKEQLPSVEMDQLRKEQREWIDYRDNTAKEASLKYEGGTMEQYEYVRVENNLTVERCFALVEDYMK